MRLADSGRRTQAMKRLGSRHGRFELLLLGLGVEVPEGEGEAWGVDIAERIPDRMAMPIVPAMGVSPPFLLEIEEIIRTAAKYSQGEPVIVAIGLGISGVFHNWCVKEVFEATVDDVINWFVGRNFSASTHRPGPQLCSNSLLLPS
jgi:hypothetical protein